jgi:hypothetical protein
MSNRRGFTQTVEGLTDFRFLIFDFRLKIQNPKSKIQNGLRGQTALEYGVLMAIVVAALLTMQVYAKRGLSGKARQSADSMGEQYDPTATTSDVTVTAHTDTTTASELLKDQVIGPGQTADVMVTTTTLNASTTDRTGSETVGALKQDVWQ